LFITNRSTDDYEEFLTTLEEASALSKSNPS